MSEYEWNELYTLLAHKLFELYEKYENIKNLELKINYEKGNEFFFEFLNSSQNKYFGEIIYDMCASKSEFFPLFNWARNISEKSLDPFHIFVSFNYNNITLDGKIERLQFYFDIFQININVSKHLQDNRFSVPHITPVKLLTNRTKKTQNDIWNFFVAVMSNNKEGIKKGFNNYKNWYGIAFPVMTEFLFWIDSSKYISLDKNTQKLLLKYNIINEIPKDYDSYLDFINKKNNFSENIFRLIVKYSYDFNLPDKKNDKKELLNFLNNFNKEKTEIIADSTEDLSIKFQLIAINLLKSKESNRKFIKNLKQNTLYQLNKNFEIIDNKGIKYKKEEEINLYDLKENNINISVVVGKNGTGKSTLLELSLSIMNNFIIKKLDINKEKLKYVDNIYAELYFKTDNLYKIEIKNNNFKIEKYILSEIFKDGTIYFMKDESYNQDYFNKNNLFYTQHINYSLHSLNSNYFGDFLEGLFHKSDEYKTPILIEPKRIRGNININSQLELMKDRLLSYVLTNEQKGLKKLVNDKIIKNIKLEIDYEKLLYNETIYYDNNQYNNLIENIKNVFMINFELEIIEDMELPTNHEFNYSIYQDNRTRDEEIKKNCSGYKIEFYFLHYIINKLKTMSSKMRFEGYKNFINDSNVLINFLKDIKNDSTYKSKKIKRAIYSLIFLNKLKYQIENNFDVIEFSKLIENEILSKNDLFLENLLPPSFFKVNLILENEGTLEALSSGEKQKIFILYTILYHLKNINEENNYNFINIVLDEIELYFHPEMQKDFIYDLIDIIKESSELRGLDFNFIFITHSPFILSDTFSNNLLKLDLDEEKQAVPKNNYENTFAGNIYNLLNDSFFMNSFIGKFAETKINEIIKIIDEYKEKKEKNPDEFMPNEKALDNLKIVKSIGEPLLKNKLEDEIKSLVKDDIMEIVNNLKGMKNEEIEKELEKYSQFTQTKVLMKLLEIRK